MTTRIITGIALLATGGALIAIQGWFSRIAFLVIMLISMYEMFGAFSHKGMKAVKWPGYMFCALVFLSQSFAAELEWLSEPPLIIALIFSAMCGIICVVLRGKPDFEGLVATIFPMLYPGIFYAAFMALQDFDGVGVSTLALIMAILTSAMNDTAALFVGKSIGKRKLIPGISPNKTVEGSLGGLAASVVFSVAIPLVYGAFYEGAVIAEWWVYAVFGLAAGVISQLGDLTASLIKRYCGIKDYGKIFPGHGGMMDRLDAILFNATACYMFFSLLGH